MHSINCPKCGEEMEKVIGFPGYVWCRDCHITKKVEECNSVEDKCISEESKEVPVKIPN